jgi:hypothetical protein
MYPGEMHATLRDSKGKKRVASYMGPGTQVVKRIKRGDMPVSDIDRVSQSHDIRYSLAKNSADIREADRRMIKRAKTSSDSFSNRQKGLRGIQAKYAAETVSGVRFPSQKDMDNRY